MDFRIETLWEQFNTPLRAFIRSRVPAEDAEDILQEIFIRIHTNILSLRDARKIKSWVFQIARNAIIDHYRRSRSTAELTEAIPQPCDCDDENAETELAAGLRELVEELPEPYRQALLLTEFEGLSQKALAAQMGISLSGAKTRVQRARERVKIMLLNCCHFEFDRRGRVIDYYQHCCCCTGEISPN